MSFDAEYRGLQRREERLDEIFGNGKARVNRNFSTGDLIRRFVEVVVGEGVCGCKMRLVFRVFPRCSALRDLLQGPGR